MPKIKTHSGAKKRFRITGTGKVMHESANKRHLLEGKPSKRTRRISGIKQLSKADARTVERLLGKR
ncbi:MAG: 50S ribosomal protein L35 [Actinobacteria bacterium]|nr:50S ribosomal protein L35 [Actinomycetota bacterium]